MTIDVGRLTAALADRYRIERELGAGCARDAEGAPLPMTTIAKLAKTTR